MAVVTAQATVTSTTTPTSLASGVDATEFFFRTSAPVFVGPDTVSQTNGFALHPDDPPLRLELGTGEDLYAVLANRSEVASAKVYILKNPG